MANTTWTSALTFFFKILPYKSHIFPYRSVFFTHTNLCYFPIQISFFPPSFDNVSSAYRWLTGGELTCGRYKSFWDKLNIRASALGDLPKKHSDRHHWCDLLWSSVEITRQDKLSALTSSYLALLRLDKCLVVFLLTRPFLLIRFLFGRNPNPLTSSLLTNTLKNVVIN